MAHERISGNCDLDATNVPSGNSVFHVSLSIILSSVAPVQRKRVNKSFASRGNDSMLRT